MGFQGEDLPRFAEERHGYVKAQVDEYVGAWLVYRAEREAQVDGLTAELASCHDALQEAREALTSARAGGDVPQRLTQILGLANEEADELRARARAEATGLVQDAEREARELVDRATLERAVVEQDIRRLEASRDRLVGRLAALAAELSAAVAEHRRTNGPLGASSGGEADATEQTGIREEPILELVAGGNEGSRGQQGNGGEATIATD
jgi:hypothetical protein